MNWKLTESDRELFARELESFVPERIFDAHAHLYSNRHFSIAPPSLCGEGPPEAGWDTYCNRIDEITPGRRTSGLFFGYPALDMDSAAGNEFVMREVRRDPASRGQMLITPEMDPEFIRQTVRRAGFAGLKCHHFYAPESPTFLAPIPSYLPEEHVRIAHEEGLSITIHLVRPRVLADPHNREILQAWCRKYHNVRFILAHAACGFNPHHTIEGIGALRGLRNVWCDTSAISDSGAFEAIVETLGVDRLMYGSDFPTSHMRGRGVAMGDSFIWLLPEALNSGYAYLNYLQPTLLGIESLRTLKLACRFLHLGDSAIERIFSGNAAELFGLKL